nr:MAG TPA: hypothetical protein [Inoviridae sp.]
MRKARRVVREKGFPRRREYQGRRGSRIFTSSRVKMSDSLPPLKCYRAMRVGRPKPVL